MGWWFPQEKAPRPASPGTPSLRALKRGPAQREGAGLPRGHSRSQVCGVLGAEGGAGAGRWGGEGVRARAGQPRWGACPSSWLDNPRRILPLSLFVPALQTQAGRGLGMSQSPLGRAGCVCCGGGLPNPTGRQGAERAPPEPVLSGCGGKTHFTRFPFKWKPLWPSLFKPSRGPISRRVPAQARGDLCPRPHSGWAPGGRILSWQAAAPPPSAHHTLCPFLACLDLCPLLFTCVLLLPPSHPPGGGAGGLFPLRGAALCC